MMTLALADAIIAGARRRAAAAGSKPLTIAVVDAGGLPVALAREDGCGAKRAKLSFDKAESALALGMPTRTLAQFWLSNKDMHAVLCASTGSSLLPLAGGVLVRDAEGFVIGAVGVSGGSLETEETFVIEAIHEAGFASDPAEIA